MMRDFLCTINCSICAFTLRVRLQEKAGDLIKFTLTLYTARPVADPKAYICIYKDSSDLTGKANTEKKMQAPAAS